MSQQSIHFPSSFDPKSAPVFVHNELDIKASPEKVWFWLTNAVTWHEWYFNASNVQLPAGNNGHLMDKMKFTWKTFGVPLQSEVVEFIPNERIAWTALGTGVRAYHAWLLIPTELGCKVVTEETQHGFLCRLGQIFMPNRMYKYHQTWLEGLSLKAGAKT